MAHFNPNHHYFGTFQSSSPQENLPTQKNINHSQNRHYYSGSSVRSDSVSTQRRISLSAKSIKERIEKACPTMSFYHLKKENCLLQRELQKIQKELLRKDQQILNLKTFNVPNKQLKTELNEVYKALHHYEGRNKELQNQVVKFKQIVFCSEITSQTLNQLFSSLTADNEELHGILEQTEYQRWICENKLKKMESHYFEINRQLSAYKRKQQKFNQVPTVAGRKNTIKFVKEIEEPKKEKQKLLFKKEEEIAELKNKIEVFEENQANLKAEKVLLQTQIYERKQQNLVLMKKYALLRKRMREIQPYAGVVDDTRNKANL